MTDSLNRSYDIRYYIGSRVLQYKCLTVLLTQDHRLANEIMAFCDTLKIEPIKWLKFGKNMRACYLIAVSIFRLSRPEPGPTFVVVLVREENPDKL